MSMWWKLFLGYLLVLVVALSALSAYLAHELTGHQVASLESALYSQALLSRDIAAIDFGSPQGRTHLNTTARRLGRETKLRVTFIARDGSVLGDSEHDIRTMENHASRPEVRQALGGVRGRSIHFSQTLRTTMLYVAVPVVLRGETVGVARIAMPLYAIAAATRRMRWMVLSAALIALAAAMMVSAKIAHNVGRRVAALSNAANRLASGDLEARVRVRGSDELATLASVFNDMAVRLRETMRALREEKHTTDTILERLGDAIVVTDAAGGIIVWNAAAQRVFGSGREQVLGLTVLNATQNHSLDDAFRQAQAGGETVTAEVQLLFPQPRILQAAVTALTAGEPLGAVAVLREVTELRRLEAVRREFVANASHELQTPIAAIKALAETLLADSRDNPAVVERFLRDLESQADRLAALVKDLLDLAQIEAGPVQLELSEVSVAEVAEEVAAQLAPLAEQRGVAVTCDIPQQVRVVADRAALRKIMANLLDNAIKYTEPGGEAGVTAQRRGDRIAISVCDTGIGILSSDLPRIFERFYRVDKSRSRELGGTGLGLSIVKHLVEALGGDIAVASEPRKGSRFTVTLPACG
jgi:two-component system phosphate regulon sensor histidine kinase PhoR